MSWTCPPFLANGKPLARPLLEALRHLKRAEGPNAAFLPKPNIPRGGSLLGVEGYFRTSMSPALFMRLFHSLLSLPPLCLNITLALLYISYSLRRFAPTWADLRGLSEEAKNKLGDAEILHAAASKKSQGGTR